VTAIPPRSSAPSWLRHWSGLLVLGLVIVAAGQTPWLSALVYPFRVFSTFVHELGHGFAAVLTGGDFVRFEVRPDLSGTAWSHGGLRIVVASAGYVGSAVAGGLLVLLHQRWMSARALLLALGALLALSCLLFIGNLFGAVAGLGLAALLLLAGLRLSESWRDALLATLALQLMLDGFNSLFTVLRLSAGTGCNTDAHTMAELTYIPAPLWALAWIGFSSFILYHALRLAFVSPASGDRNVKP
jgi:hypothetical protein